jgi:predicted transcriptional regulator
MQNEPNFQKSQMFITVVSTMSCNKKMKLDTWSKRTQTNPIYSVLIRVNLWLNSKRTQIYPAIPLAGKTYLRELRVKKFAKICKIYLTLCK